MADLAGFGDTAGLFDGGGGGGPLESAYEDAHLHHMHQIHAHANAHAHAHGNGARHRRPTAFATTGTRHNAAPFSSTSSSSRTLTGSSSSSISDAAIAATRLNNNNTATAASSLNANNNYNNDTSDDPLDPTPSPASSSSSQHHSSSPSPPPLTSNSIDNTTAILISVIVTAPGFFGSFVYNLAREIWPNSILFYIAAVQLLVVWAFISRGIAAVLAWHPNPQWADFWMRILNFISSAFLLVIAYYIIGMIFALFDAPTIVAPQIFLVSTSAVLAGVFVTTRFVRDTDADDRAAAAAASS
jgi:hypothetical protein